MIDEGDGSPVARLTGSSRPIGAGSRLGCGLPRHALTQSNASLDGYTSRFRRFGRHPVTSRAPGAFAAKQGQP